MGFFTSTTATKRIFNLKKRIRAVSGGTAASKTISILIWIIDYGQSTANKIVTVVSESYPHLEGGAIRDFKSIMKSQDYWEDDCWNESKHIYTFGRGTIVEFKSIDKFGKAHGPRRDVLFLNEANNVDYKIADQLITRTRQIVWMDWNPSSEFWFYTEMLNKRDDIEFITLTYLDNEALDQNTITEIESHKNNKSWWKVYGLGELGEIEGRIYKDWEIIDEVPHFARLERRGLDFGYSTDPSSIIDIYYLQGGYVLDEQLYQKGMLNDQISSFILNLENPNILVVADSAEPKSIDEIKLRGVNIIGAEKGADSVRNGIAIVQGQRISVTKRSINLIKEYRNYLWKKDNDDNYITPNIPEDGLLDHALDAVRYGLVSILKQPTFKTPEQSKPLDPYYSDIGL